MALVAHTIVSRYIPQRDPVTQSENDAWETETPFGSAQRRHSRPVPYFVPASLEYDEYGMPKSDLTKRPYEPGGYKATADVSLWYRSLTSKGKARQHHADSGELSRSPPAPSSCTSSQDPAPGSQLMSSSTRSPSPPRPVLDWFMSDPRAKASGSTIAPHIPKPSAFADLLSRNPPPLPSEPAFKPPVFLALGPDNKGFAMLERKGWQEGEGLGSARVVRRSNACFGKKKRGTENVCGVTLDAEEHKAVLEQVPVGLHHATTTIVNCEMREVIDLTLSSESYKEQEVVDLTLSDSLSDSDREHEETVRPSDSSEPPKQQPHGITLLTPIATTLKADRLGIGLKPRRIRNKAITHTPSVLAAHIRSANRMRKEKARHGRGSRGFARKKEEESRERISMLTYMNS